MIKVLIGMALEGLGGIGAIFAFFGYIMTQNKLYLLAQGLGVFILIVGYLITLM